MSRVRISRPKKRQNIRAVHDAVHTTDPDVSILEVSSASVQPEGEAVSSLRLLLHLDSVAQDVPISTVFEATKVFEHGGPLLSGSSGVSGCIKVGQLFLLESAVLQIAHQCVHFRHGVADWRSRCENHAAPASHFIQITTLAEHIADNILGNSLGTFRHKQDSTLVAEQTTIFSVYIFLRVNI